MNDGKWLAVYTRPRWERKVTEQLEKRKIVSYCPLRKINGQWQDRRKNISEPLFPSYVFVYVTEKDQQSVLQISGIMNFVFWLGQPAVICREELETIKNFLNEYPEVRIEKTQVNKNEQVRVVNGPQMLRKGNLLEVRNSTVKVMLPSLGHALVAEIRKDQVDSVVYSGEETIRV